MATALRCGARTRKGIPCCIPALRGGRRCRMHGGSASGPSTANRNVWKHGYLRR
ncbi:MAG: HGGxSTG domain-containing protein [Alphaproteobacteria bacterium]